jgi:AcrR family transcriptional regulator
LTAIFNRAMHARMTRTSVLTAAKPRRAKGAKQIARREDVARATFAVIARDGLERTSMRAIAHEMQCSTGVLTHHFRDKAELMKFALDVLLDQLVVQMADAAEMKGADPLQRIILALLPNDPESELRWRVILSVTAASINEPSLQDDQERRETAIHEWYVNLLARMRDRGVVRKDINLVLEADCISSFVDGLAMHTILSPERFGRARQAKLVARYLHAIT